MSDARGLGGWIRKMLADVIRRLANMGQWLLTREPQTLTTKVRLNDQVISHMKQQLPVFRAIELTALNDRFAKTAFEKPTVSMSLIRLDKLVHMKLLRDLRRNVPLEYKERCRRRESAMSIETFADLLKSVTDKGSIRTLTVIRVTDSLLKLFLQAESLAPVRFRLMIESSKSTKEYLAPLMKHFAETGKVQRASLFFSTITDRPNWQQVEECLAPFTSLQCLHLRMKESPPSSSDWLKNAIVANSQLKQLTINDRLYFLPVVADAISTIALIGYIRIVGCIAGQLMDYVDVELLVGGRHCTVTKLVLAMPQTGCLKWELYPLYVMDDDDEYFYGNMLRFCHYLLHLHKTGKAVVVKVMRFPGWRLAEFIQDVSNFYYPRTETTFGADGDDSYFRGVRVGSVTIDFFYAEEEEDDEDEDEEN